MKTLSFLLRFNNTSRYKKSVFLFIVAQCDKKLLHMQVFLLWAALMLAREEDIDGSEIKVYVSPYLWREQGVDNRTGQ